MGGTPAWVLGEVLTAIRLKNLAFYKIYHEVSDLDWPCWAT